MSMMMLSPSLLKTNPSANDVAPAIRWIAKSLNRCWSWSRLVKLASRVEYTRWWRSCARTRLWRSRSSQSAMTRSTPSMWCKRPVYLARSTRSSSFWWCISWSRCWSKHMICRSFCNAATRIWAMQRQRLPAPSHSWRQCGATTRTSWRSTIKPRSSLVIMPLMSPIAVKPCSNVPKTFARGCPRPDTLVDPPPSSTGIASTSSSSSSTKSWTNWTIDSTRVTWQCWRPFAVLCPLSFHSSIRRWSKNSQAYIGSRWTFKALTQTSSISLTPSIESWRHSPTTSQWASSTSFKLCRTCCSFWSVITKTCQWCKRYIGSRLPFLSHWPAWSDPFLRWSAS